MVLKHFEAAIMNIIFGALAWIVSRYLIEFAHNQYITLFPQWANMPQITFMVSVAQWGVFVFILIPTSIYLWTQTQRPEI